MTSILPKPLVTLYINPPTPDEWRRMRRLWRSPQMLSPKEILRRMDGRTGRDLLIMLDVILGAGRSDLEESWQAAHESRAMTALAGRAQRRFDNQHGYALDGRPADWAMVARAANVVLRGLGFPIIAGPWEKVAA
jgi:hypothetical protein